MCNLFIGFRDDLCIYCRFHFGRLVEHLGVPIRFSGGVEQLRINFHDHNDHFQRDNNGKHKSIGSYMQLL
ncbi:hypothetical protein RQP46_005329 [Phenoliferia psychrophenolica]